MADASRTPQPTPISAIGPIDREGAAHLGPLGERYVGVVQRTKERALVDRWRAELLKPPRRLEEVRDQIERLTTPAVPGTAPLAGLRLSGGSLLIVRAPIPATPEEPRWGGLTDCDAFAAAARIAAAVEELHEAGRVHGNIAPHLVCAETVQPADGDLVSGAEVRLFDASLDAVTEESAVSGEDARWAPGKAPEVWTRGGCTPEADVYALAVTLAFGFFGPAFLGEMAEYAPFGWLAWSEDPEASLPGIPMLAEKFGDSPLVDVWTRALAKDPAARDVTARAFREALQRAAGIAPAGADAPEASASSSPVAAESPVLASVAPLPPGSLDPESLTGKSVAGFEIGRRIGRGGMGIVYEARQVRLNRRIAFKVLPADLIGRRDLVERFEREARSAANLTHRNIVTVHDVGSEGTIHYIAMEFVDGIGLDRVIDDHRRILFEGNAQSDASTPAGSAFRIHYVRTACETIAAIGDALHEGHRQGIIHRDVKPQNILVAADGVPKLVDFGLARDARDDAISAAGAFIGTYVYASPEQVAAKSTVDRRCDVYALGATLYELLTLRRPFEGSGDEVFRRIQVPGPPAMREFNPGVPAALETIVARALAKDPKDRYGSAQEISVALSEFLRQATENELLAASPTATALQRDARSSAAVGTPVVSGVRRVSSVVIERPLAWPRTQTSRRLAIKGRVEDPPLGARELRVITADDLVFVAALHERGEFDLDLLLPDDDYRLAFSLFDDRGRQLSRANVVDSARQAISDEDGLVDLVVRSAASRIPTSTPGRPRSGSEASAGGRGQGFGSTAGGFQPSTQGSTSAAGLQTPRPGSTPSSASLGVDRGALELLAASYRLDGPVFPERYGAQAGILAVEDESRHLLTVFAGSWLRERPGVRERLVRDAASLGSSRDWRLDVPVTVRDLEDGSLALVHEATPCRTAADAMASRGKLSFPVVAAWTRALFECLELAHGKGLVHGALEPARVALDEEGGARRVRILGFARDGAVALADPGASELGAGTLATFVDVHAAARVVYGITLLDAPPRPTRAGAKLEIVDPLRRLRPDVPKPFAVALERALNDPRAFPTATSFLRAAFPPKRSPVPAILAVVALLAVSGFGAFAWTQHPEWFRSEAPDPVTPGGPGPVVQGNGALGAGTPGGATPAGGSASNATTPSGHAATAASDAYDAAMARARELMTRGTPGDAISAFEEARAARPGDPVATESLVAAYLSESRRCGDGNDWVSALRCLQVGREALPGEARIIDALADVYGELGLASFQASNLEDALTKFQEGLALRSSHPRLVDGLVDTRVALGSRLIEGGKLDEAVSELLKAEELRKGDPRVVDPLVDALKRRARNLEGTDRAAALASLDSALARRPDDAEAIRARERLAPAGQVTAPSSILSDRFAFEGALDKDGWPEVLVHKQTGIRLRHVPRATNTVGIPTARGAQDSVTFFDQENRPRPVVVDYVLYVAETETTRGQWAAGGGEARPGDPHLPVVNVRFDQAQRFAKDVGLSIPTDDEWQFAALGGQTSPSVYGFDDAQRAVVHGTKAPEAVGARLANDFGLQDVLGNVAEWAEKPGGDPVACGGSYRSENAPRTYRREYASEGSESIGFRLVLRKK